MQFRTKRYRKPSSKVRDQEPSLIPENKSTDAFDTIMQPT